MKIVAPVIAGTLGFVLFWTHLAMASQPLSSYNLLQDVVAEHKDGSLLIQVKFRKPPVEFNGPDFFKKSIQLDFPSAYVNPSKRYFETGDDRVRQVYVSQFDPKRLRLRLILAPGESIGKDEIQVVQEGRTLQIRIASVLAQPKPIRSRASDSLESLLARASRIQKSKAEPAEMPASPSPKTHLSNATESVVALAKEVISPPSSKILDKPVPEPSEASAQTVSTEPGKLSASSQPLVLKSQKAGIMDFDNDLSIGKPDMFTASIKMASTLGLVLGLMFVIFHLFKKFGLKNSVFGGGEGKPIKVLSTGFLAPRKSIALVEVAGDVLVLGISNDQISLLGTVQDPERIDQIKGAQHKKGQAVKSEEPSPEIAEEVEEAPITRKEIRPKADKEGVDVYKKRLIQSGSTNPFGEYVKQFAHAPGAEPTAMKDVVSRVRKTLGEAPVFK